ncbi:hypothetical protein CEP54_010386 [Fusarium duplospermum]|uniref:Uncharacterized protein n=1 Tax=Fusarium duplospermum TaxID=1325734 RepID=A0A428PKF7_9HYPO|nr:hypothetical protein CEP54_010386 [Fusarium duplospermum]
MSKTESRPEPPEIREKGFRLSYGRFTAAVGDIGRVEGSRLRVLFNPGSLRLKRDQKEAQEAAKVLNTKQFLAGQLRHYGIKFPSSAKNGDLRDLLRDAVFAGKCNQVPASVMLLRDSMERKLAPLHKKWEDDVRAWDARKKQKEDEAFNKCTTPGERANCDLGRFLDYYFLTNGEPDQTKTPEAFAVYGFDGRASLHHMAERIPRLHTMSGGPDKNRTLCIGWSHSAVSCLAMAIGRQAYEEEKKKEESKWEEAMKAHQHYLSKSGQGSSSQGKKKPAGKSKPAQRFELGRCIGSYIVKCDAVSDGWSSMSDFTMDICEGKGGTLMADYYFGIIKGAMLLSQNEETLDALTGAGDDSDDGSGDVSDSEESDDDDEEEEDDDDERPKTKKRMPKHIGASKKGAASASKRRKLTPSLARRVYYRLRGLETGEGQILPDSEPGHLDFIGDSCTKFVGLAYYFPYVGKNVEFRGYKVSDVPKRRAAGWDDFSWGSYESARRGRWH